MRILSTAAFLGAALALATGAQAESRTFNLTMLGANEANSSGQLGVGDPDGIANAMVTLDGDQDMVSWTVNYQNITGDSVFGFHIHGPDATLTTNRPVFIDMSPVPAAPTPNGTLSGMKMTTDIADLGSRIDQVLANPSGFYLNLHSNGTGGFPSGAVRAQLPEPGAIGVLAVAALGLLRRRSRA